MQDIPERIADALERIAAALEKGTETTLVPLAPEALSKDDAAKFIGVDVSTIEHLIRTRKLAYVQTGSQRGRLIPVESLRQLLASFQQRALVALPRKG